MNDYEKRQYKVGTTLICTNTIYRNNNIENPIVWFKGHSYKITDVQGNNILITIEKDTVQSGLCGKDFINNNFKLQHKLTKKHLNQFYNDV